MGTGKFLPTRAMIYMARGTISISGIPDDGSGEWIYPNPSEKTANTEEHISSKLLFLSCHTRGFQ